jgi:hypothetical protein
MAGAVPILGLDVLESLPEPVRDGARIGIEAGWIFGTLKAFPEREVREHMDPEVFAGIMPELLLRMAESMNRPFRTEPSKVFRVASTQEHWIELVFGPCEPIPDWLKAEQAYRNGEGMANG